MRSVELVELWCKENDYWSLVSFPYPLPNAGPHKISFITISKPMGERGITLRFVGNLRVEWRKNGKNPEYFKRVLGSISDPEFFLALETILEEYYEQL